jgi:signal transduction histidine kinase
MSIPIKYNESTLGVVIIYSQTENDTYTDDDFLTLQIMVNQTGVALRKNRLFERLENMHDEVIELKHLATLGTALAALQHRINNNLGIITPCLMRLRQRVDMNDETIVKVLNMIEHSTRYTLRTISRTQKPLRKLESQDVDINAVLFEISQKAKEQRQNDSIVFEFDLDKSIPKIKAPIEQVTEIFQNLIDNAYDAIKTEGTITVSSRLLGNGISVKIQDTGSGIPPKIQDRLFVKPISTKDSEEGLGLGLCLINSC